MKDENLLLRENSGLEKGTELKTPLVNGGLPYCNHTSQRSGGKVIFCTTVESSSKEHQTKTSLFFSEGVLISTACRVNIGVI